MTKMTYAVLRTGAPPEIRHASVASRPIPDFAPDVGYPMQVLNLSADALPGACLIVSLPSPFSSARIGNPLATRLAGQVVEGNAVLTGPEDAGQHLTSLDKGWVKMLKEWKP